MHVEFIRGRCFMEEGRSPNPIPDGALDGRQRPMPGNEVLGRHAVLVWQERWSVTFGGRPTHQRTDPIRPGHLCLWYRQLDTKEDELISDDLKLDRQRELSTYFELTEGLTFEGMLERRLHAGHASTFLRHSRGLEGESR